MNGACSNQIIKCIIYTHNIEAGRKKLSEIKKEKYKKGIKILKERIADHVFYENEVVFDDGEEWIILNPSGIARGYRWRKAWVDAHSVTIEELYDIILATGDLYRWEDAKFFNYSS